MNVYLRLIGKMGLPLIIVSLVPLNSFPGLANPQPELVNSQSQPNSPLETNKFQESLDATLSKNAFSGGIDPITTQLAGDVSLQAAMEQVTSVSQLSDVQSTDWAFQALQSLVERYGCIAGYPDSTYRGNRALTRYEFAAGLNACLDRVNELIAAGTTNFVQKEDLIALQKLQEQFAAELATLRGRVDAVEAQTATLERQQFSTTTKLNGEVIFSLAGGVGGEPNGDDAEVVLNDRVRLNLVTSFDGKDLLITGLQAYNFRGSGPFFNQGTIQGTLFPNQSAFSFGSTKLSYEPLFPGFNVETLSPDSGGNNIALYKLAYLRPLSKQFLVFAGTKAEITDVFPAIAPYASEGQGALSRFAGYNAAVRITAGPSGVGLLAGAGFIWTPSETVKLVAIYGNGSANIPNDEGLLRTPLGAGFFTGTGAFATQLTLRPTSTLNIGLNYANSYHTLNILGTGLASSDIGAIPFTPNAAQLARFGGNATLAVLDRPIKVNSVGASVNWQFAPKVSITGHGAVLFSQLLDVDASADFTSWSVGLNFTDVLQEGNAVGLIFGQPLYRSSVGGRAFRPEDATPYHLEGFFKYQVSDNISITPGVIVLFNPEGFEDNDTTVVGAIRTTFTF